MLLNEIINDDVLTAAAVSVVNGKDIEVVAADTGIPLQTLRGEVNLINDHIARDPVKAKQLFRGLKDSVIKGH